MACKCNHRNTRVIDSRKDGVKVYRVRECKDCGKRLQTVERVVGDEQILELRLVEAQSKLYQIKQILGGM